MDRYTVQNPWMGHGFFSKLRQREEEQKDKRAKASRESGPEFLGEGKLQRWTCIYIYIRHGNFHEQTKILQLVRGFSRVFFGDDMLLSYIGGLQFRPKKHCGDFVDGDRHSQVGWLPGAVINQWEWRSPLIRNPGGIFMAENLMGFTQVITYML